MNTRTRRWLIGVFAIAVIAAIAVFALLMPPSVASSVHLSAASSSASTLGATTTEQVGGLTYVYSSVNGPSDCTSYEQYDQARQACYYTCATQAECDATANKVDAEIASWSSQAPAIHESAAASSASSSTTLATYKVSSGEKITFVSGTDKQAYRDIWQLFTGIEPDSYAGTYITGFQLYNDPNDDTDALMQSPTDNGHWALTVNLAVFNTDTHADQVYTLIHELGHVITLNPSQLDITASQDSCQDFFTGEGCAYPNSYIEKFVEDFWTQPMIDEADAQSQDAATPQVYTDYPGQFVTEYAATNPGEDIAESWTAFVLHPSRERGSSIAAQKVAFFEQFPELIKLRASIRSAEGLPPVS